MAMLPAGGVYLPAGPTPSERPADMKLALQILLAIVSLMPPRQALLARRAAP